MPDLSLEKDALQAVIKKRMGLVEQRCDVSLMMADDGLRERHASKLLELDRTPYRYEPRPGRNAGLRPILMELAIHRDKGLEFTSRHFLSWCERRQIRPVFIEPGQPMQNGHIESFNGRLRDECLNANWLLTLAGGRAKIETWWKEYHSQRPLGSLRYLSPEELAAR